MLFPSNIAPFMVASGARTGKNPRAVLQLGGTLIGFDHALDLEVGHLVEVAACGEDACKAAEGEGAAVVHARAKRRVVSGAEVVARSSAADEELADRLVVGIKDMQRRIGVQAARHGEKRAHESACVERRLDDRRHQLLALAKVVVMPLGAELVVACDGLFETFGGHAHLLCQFFERIGHDDLAVLDVLGLRGLFNLGVPACAPGPV